MMYRKPVYRWLAMMLAVIIGLSTFMIQQPGWTATAADIEPSTSPQVQQVGEPSSNMEVDRSISPSPSSWIIQWEGTPPGEIWDDSEVVTYYEETHVTVVRPKEGVDTTTWITRWQSYPGVDSFQPNQKVQAALQPNDSKLTNQRYLQQIRAASAWDVQTESDLIIAVVDTGVDRQHPDLADRLLPGINLINRDAPPDDDNGHGTNVVGVIAAVPNNEIGTAGLLWKTRIMPIKALESDGNGDEDKLGEGIRYAVANGAKIVVLSLGLNKYSAYMAKVVQEAEEQGVLLVAASGNEGTAVKYPAAYDSVLAIGGVREDNERHPLSNLGPELDLLAPWIVYTTARNGGYVYKDGTSMAAPQAAAVAALAWSRNPGLKPWEVRNLLRQTAQDLGKVGWEKETGYGLLRADRAVREALKPDLYEPNNRQAAAKPISSAKSIHAYLDSGDEDWFYWDAPYDGFANYTVSNTGIPIDLVHVPDNGGMEQTVRASQLSAGASVPVTKGRYYVRLSSSSATGSAYTFGVQFQIYRDPFEDNDRLFKAYSLPARSQLIVGTFHQHQDQDWFTVQIERQGTLKLKVTTDTPRIDPVLAVSRRGEREVVIDHNGDGQMETYQVDVKPGTYDIRIANFSNQFPVVGEYALDLDLASTYVDPYEPNDKSFQATTLQFGENYYGVIEPETDVDWFRFRLDGESMLRLDVSPVPDTKGLAIQLLDNSLKPRELPIDTTSSIRWTAQAKLQAGTYYLKLSSKGGQRNQFYGIRVQASLMVEGYSDVSGHWAEAPITKLIKAGYVNGYGTYRFFPDSPITRAEAAVLLDRILKPGAATSAPGFEDLPSTHWAYPAVARLARAGVINGYTKTIYAPERNISRMEMMTMLANATGKKGQQGKEAPFKDVAANYWGAPVLRQLKAEGWAAGYQDGTFRPERLATRAEFMTLVVKMLKL